MCYDREASSTAETVRRQRFFSMPLCESGCKVTNLFLIAQYQNAKFTPAIMLNPIVSYP